MKPVCAQSPPDSETIQKQRDAMDESLANQAGIFRAQEAADRRVEAPPFNAGDIIGRALLEEHFGVVFSPASSQPPAEVADPKSIDRSNRGTFSVEPYPENADVAEKPLFGSTRRGTFDATPTPQAVKKNKSDLSQKSMPDKSEPKTDPGDINSNQQNRRRLSRRARAFVIGAGLAITALGIAGIAKWAFDSSDNEPQRMEQTAVSTTAYNNDAASTTVAAPPTIPSTTTSHSAHIEQFTQILSAWELDHPGQQGIAALQTLDGHEVPTGILVQELRAAANGQYNHYPGWMSPEDLAKVGNFDEQ